MGNEWKNMESADGSQFPWQRLAFPTHSLSLSFSCLVLCLTHSLTSFTLHFLFSFFPFFKDRLSIITLQPSFSSPISSLFFLSYLLIFSLLSFSYLPIKCSLNPSSPKPSFTQVRHVPFLSSLITLFCFFCLFKPTALDHSVEGEH